MGRFLNSQALKDKEGKHLLTVDYSKPDNQLSISQMEMGEKTRSALSKLPSDQQKKALRGIKQFYVGTTKYRIGHLPIDNKLLRDVSFLHPLLSISQHGTQAIRRVAVIIPTISEEEVALVTDEWKVYSAGDIDADSTTRRADHYWTDVFQEKSQQGEFKYPVLQKLVKSLLSLAHGNADEREKELMQSEDQKDSELQTAKTLYEEANERLSQAIKNKKTLMRLP